ncbi:MAG: hypothetical protein Q4B17_14565, partial [Lautropia sp.]|nr:hypothetical protein [Lautropia sp.]
HSSRWAAGVQGGAHRMFTCIEQMRQIDWNCLPLEKRCHRSVERLKRWLDRAFKTKRARYLREYHARMMS